jgi:malonate transporter and related proteins
VNAVAIVVTPVFGTVVLGYALARWRLFSAEAGTALVRFMYYVAIPAMLFRSLAGADLPPRIPWAYLAAFYGPALASFLFAMYVARVRFGWQRREEGIAGMAASYSNMVMLGYPLTLAAFGHTGSVPMFILLATQSTLLFPLVTYSIEGRGDAGFRWRDMAKLALNPVILSLVLGVAANIGASRLPPALDHMLELLGAAGPGCALIALGIGLAQYKLGGGYRNVAQLVILKNFVYPGAVWLACRMSGVTGEWLYVAVLLAAMPTGINAFIFSSKYGIREETISKTIVVSTLISSIVVTVLLGLFMGSQASPGH